jgi:hypothetical protein
MVMAALLLGLVLGGALILYKRMTARDGLDPQREADSFRVTPS